MCDYAPNRERAMTVIERDAGGTATVWCDPCIAPLVTALNAAGLRTVASCCGHGKGPGRISLADGKELLIFESMAAAEEVAPIPIPAPADADLTSVVFDALHNAEHEPVGSLTMLELARRVAGAVKASGWSRP